MTAPGNTSQSLLPDTEKLLIMEALDHIYLSRRYQEFLIGNKIGGQMENMGQSESKIDSLIQPIPLSKVNTSRFFSGPSISQSYVSDSRVAQPVPLLPELVGGTEKVTSQENIGSSSKCYPLFRSAKKPNSGGSHRWSLSNIHSGGFDQAVRGQRNQKMKNEDDNWDSSTRSGFKHKNIYDMVFCMFRESANQYWVMKKENVEIYERIQRQLNRDCRHADVISPVVNQVYGCEYQGELFRAKVLKIKPKLTVHFIDFGNVHTYDQISQCRKLPESLLKSPALVFCVEFKEGTPAVYNIENLDGASMVLSHTGKMNGNVSVVEIKKGPFGPTKQCTDHADRKPQVQTSRQTQKKSEEQQGKSTSTQRNALLTPMYEIDEVTESSKGIIYFLPEQQRMRLGLIIPEKYGDAHSYFDKILSLDLSNMTPIRAQEGDYVFVSPKLGFDYFGRVLNVIDGIYHVHLRDTGKIIKIGKVYSADSGMGTDHRVIVSVVDVLCEDSVLDSKCYFQMTERISESGNWYCDLRSTTKNSVIAKAIMGKPPKACLDFVFNFLKSGCTVRISKLGKLNTLFVQKLSDKFERKLSLISEKLQCYGPTASNLTSPIEVGTTCCIQSKEDDNFYRGLVLEVNQDILSILLVDIGDIQESHWNTLKPPHPDLIMMPFLATEIKLVQASSEPFVQKARTYLQGLADQKLELTLTYEEYLECVVLTEKKTKKNINDFIMQLRTESDARNTSITAEVKDVKMEATGTSEEPETSESDQIEDKVIYYDSDFKSLEFLCGNTYDLFVLYLDDTEYAATGSFWATNQNDPNFIYVNSELSNKINEYCAASSRPYKPKLEEACLAEFEGVWCRAIVIDLEHDQDRYCIFFVDFGNTCTVSSESIRKIKRDFLVTPVLAYSCNIVDRSRLASNPSLSEKILELLKNRVNGSFLQVELCKIEDDIFALKIPEIEAIIAESDSK